MEEIKKQILSLEEAQADTFNRGDIDGRGTHIYVHKDDGWKIVHEHFSRTHHTYERKT